MISPPTLADRAAYLPEEETLICADLHLGRDAAADVELPLGERQRLPARIESLLARFDPEHVVLAGDVLHSFDRIPSGTAETLSRIETAVSGSGGSLVVVAGNHDTMLPSVLEELDGSYRLHDRYRVGDDTIVCHGHESPEDDAKRYVIGHDHPAIEVEGKRRPCYLLGPHAHRSAEVLVLPAFNSLAPGVLVNGAKAGDLQSPLLGPLGEFRPAIRDGESNETLWFPPLRDLREFL